MRRMNKETIETASEVDGGGYPRVGAGSVCSKAVIKEQRYQLKIRVMSLLIQYLSMVAAFRES